LGDHAVYVTDAAARDLDDICHYIETHDSAEAADYVHGKIKEAVLSLGTAPLRGRVVPELERLGVLDFREVFFKPYRVLYFAADRNVYVYAIFDGRRDLDAVFQKRIQDVKGGSL